MKLERTITTDLPEGTIREKLAAFFAVTGYQQSISQPHVLAFRRGTFLSLTARGCPVNAVIQMSPGPDRQTQAHVTLEIDTTGQLVFKFEREYWREQLDGIENAIRAGQSS